MTTSRIDSRSDLAIVLPCLPEQGEVLYRVLASLSLQNDRRFIVYAFFQEGDEAMRSLLEDHAAGGLDILLRPVPAVPELTPQSCPFFAAQLKDEAFVTFSDGKTLYEADCIHAFQQRTTAHQRIDQFNWRYAPKPEPRISTRWRHTIRILLGWEQLPLCARVFRLSELEKLLAAVVKEQQEAAQEQR